MSSLSTASVILDRAIYAQKRAAERSRIMPLRALRRVRLGERLSLAFENRDTLNYQTQEMIYAEAISDPLAAAQEVQTYSRLLPTSHELCATLLLELTDEATVRQELARLRGLQHALRIEVGGQSATGVELPGPDEAGPNPDTHSVHFIRFRFDDAARDAFRDPAQLAVLVADHPNYEASAWLDGETRLSLIQDLNREPGQPGSAVRPH